MRLVVASVMVASFLALGGCKLENKTDDTKDASAAPIPDGGNGAPDEDATAPAGNFLSIPTAEGVRVVIEAEGWSPYDRSCGVVNEPSSFHSVGFERASITMNTDGCTPETGGTRSVELARVGGLEPGEYDIAEGTNITSQLDLAPEGLPPFYRHIQGKVRIETVTIEGDDTLLAASLYGDAKIPATDSEAEIDAVIKIAFKVRLRTIDVL